MLQHEVGHDEIYGCVIHGPRKRIAKVAKLVQPGVLRSDGVDVDADHPFAPATQAPQFPPPWHRIVDQARTSPATHIEDGHPGGKHPLDPPVERDGSVAIRVTPETTLGIEALEQVHGLAARRVVICRGTGRA